MFINGQTQRSAQTNKEQRTKDKSCSERVFFSKFSHTSQSSEPNLKGPIWHRSIQKSTNEIASLVFWDCHFGTIDSNLYVKVDASRLPEEKVPVRVVHFFRTCHCECRSQKSPKRATCAFWNQFAGSSQILVSSQNVLNMFVFFCKML